MTVVTSFPTTRKPQNHYGYTNPYANPLFQNALTGNSYIGPYIPIQQANYGYGSGYGGNGNELAQQLIQATQKAYDEAKAANETRYGDILGGKSFAANQPVAAAPAAPSASYQRIGRRSPQTTAVSNPTGNTRIGVAPQAATAANGTNYEQDAMGGYRDRYVRGMEYLDGAGEQAAKDIRSDYTKMSAQNQANLAQRGLLNSTITSNLERGVQSDQQNALNRLNDSLRQQRLQTDAQLSGDTLQFMERRNDTYPALDQYSSILNQLGQSGLINGGGVGFAGQSPQLVYAGNQQASPYSWKTNYKLNQPSAYSWK